jgi:hypothetical protein
MSARADMESASARRQSFGAAGVTLPSVLPEGLSASCAVGETRGAMVGDQSLRKAVRGVDESGVAVMVQAASAPAGISKLSRSVFFLVRWLLGFSSS